MAAPRQRPLALLGAVVTLVGFGALLYGLGFLALTAHYHSLGLWAGNIDSQDISEEGGRFLYHLIFLAPDRLVSAGWKTWVPLIAALMLAAVSSHAWGRLRRRVDPIFRSLARVPRLAVLASLLVVSVWVAETVWQVLRIADLLYVRDEWLTVFRSSETRLAFYWQVIVRIALLVIVAAGLRQRVWKQPASTIERIAVALQWAVTLSAVAIWPIAYGKLVISDLRPTMWTPPDAQEQLLIRSNGSRYFVWNPALQRMEIVDIPSGQRVALGSRRHLLE